MLIPPQIQPILFIVAIGAISWFLIKRNSGRIEKSRRENQRFDTRSSPNTISNAPPTSALALNNAPPEISRWTMELYDQMRDWQGEMQSQSVVLQSLLRIAHEETARLEQRIVELREELGAGKRGSVGQRGNSSGPLHVTEERSLPVVSEPFIDPQLMEKAFRLDDEGQSVAEIAARLGRTQGDTEFLLSLKPISHSL